MALKKQTIWLLTMLTLMVVLSAYYLFYGDVEPLELAEQNQNPTEKVGTVQEESAMDIYPESNFDIQIESVMSLPVEDHFAVMRMEREINRDQMIEEYRMVIVNSEDANEVAEANAKIDYIETIESKEMDVETLIKAEGYKDAIVLANEKEINVIVQAEELKKEQVVSIVNLVSEKMNVPGIKVTVKNRP